MSDPDWPEPVEIINEAGTSDIVLLCEHASNHIPAVYNDLGLPPDQLQRHIAWDVGAAALTRRLSQVLDAPAFLGTYSRLLIDLNRPLDAPDSMPQVSEGLDIPGNVDVTAGEARRRQDLMFVPFHREVLTHLDRRLEAGLPTRLVSIHSFTPIFFGVARPWHAGVLFLGAKDFGNAIVAALRQPGLLIEANVPYKTDRFGDYGIPIHGDDRGIPAIMLEIRNDLIVDASGIEKWGVRIAAAMGAPRSAITP